MQPRSVRLINGSGNERLYLPEPDVDPVREGGGKSSNSTEAD